MQHLTPLSVVANTSQYLAGASRILLQKSYDDIPKWHFASNGCSTSLFGR